MSPPAPPPNPLPTLISLHTPLLESSLLFLQNLTPPQIITHLHTHIHTTLHPLPALYFIHYILTKDLTFRTTLHTYLQAWAHALFRKMKTQEEREKAERTIRTWRKEKWMEGTEEEEEAFFKVRR